jgi:Pyruvate/2-oxoacid:ferredoxin oxidoreductase delta subunit
MGKKIIFCNCGSDKISRERLQSIENDLNNANINITKISDLCAVSALNAGKLKGVFRENEEYLIIGCNTRSLKLLLEKAHIETGKQSLRFINFFESDDEDVRKEISSFSIQGDYTNQAQVEEIENSTGWHSWYPLIDYSRCTECGQCADFCLFGVYEKTEGKVSVINPRGCKNNCPACARICPQTAIVFPKYKQGGAIGGSDVIDEISEQIRQAEDINSILDGDIYSALEQRRKKRRSIIIDEAMNKAIKERQDALDKQNSEKT